MSSELTESNASTIDEYVLNARTILSDATDWLEDFDAEISVALNLRQRSDYSSIIDSLYLLEDTQLAKHRFREESKKGSSPPDFGMMYLMFYGVMNACYMQQQSIIVCDSKLQMGIDLSRIKSSLMIELRNDFAAHSPNRGGGKNERSFILDRFGLLSGVVAGYSFKSSSKFESKRENMSDLLDNWDNELVNAIQPISKEIVSRVKAYLNKLS